jgi:hypothetical protein
MEVERIKTNGIDGDKEGKTRAPVLQAYGRDRILAIHVFKPAGTNYNGG